MRRTMPLLLTAALLGLTVYTALSQTTVTSPSSMQTAKRFDFKKSETVNLDYLLFLPKGCEANGTKRWPLIFFLHGAGERGNDVWKVTKHGPPHLAQANPEFPFIVVSPQCPEGQIWSNKEVLIGLLDEIINKYPVDTRRVYLTGISMGGYGTWSLGVSYPERFAAMAPICGGGEMISAFLAQGKKAAALKSMGIWAFHGAKDPVVPVDESRRMVELMKKVGVTDIKLTIYPEALHDSWTETYQNPELFEWFLKHQR